MPPLPLLAGRVVNEHLSGCGGGNEVTGIQMAAAEGGAGSSVVGTTQGAAAAIKLSPPPPPPSALPPAECSCPQCAAWRRQLRALTAMAGMLPGMEASIRVVAGGLEEHAGAVARAWVTTPATFHDAFFPTPFARFLYTGSLPSLGAIATELGVPRAPFPAGTPPLVAAWAALVGRLVQGDGGSDSGSGSGCDVPADWAPVFVVGCGRSGTTLLARMLRCHPAVVDINEARAVWLAADARLDVWSSAAARGGAAPLLQVAGDTLPRSALDTMRRLAYAALLMSPPVTAAIATAAAATFETGDGGAAADDDARVHATAAAFVLVEKLPENAFRTPMLAAAFPRARFLHIVRNRHAVAASIAKFTPTAWYGMCDVKWRVLAAVDCDARAAADDGGGSGNDASADDRSAGGDGGGTTAGAAAAVRPAGGETDMTQRGLWERDAAVAVVRRDAAAAGRRIVRLSAAAAAPVEGDALLEVHFEDVVTRPHEVWASLLAALPLPPAYDAAALDAFVARLRPDRAVAPSPAPPPCPPASPL